MICPYCSIDMEPIDLSGKVFCSNCGMTIGVSESSKEEEIPIISHLTTEVSEDDLDVLGIGPTPADKAAMIPSLSQEFTDNSVDTSFSTSTNQNARPEEIQPIDTKVDSLDTAEIVTPAQPSTANTPPATNINPDDSNLVRQELIKMMGKATQSQAPTPSNTEILKSAEPIAPEEPAQTSPTEPPAMPTPPEPTVDQVLASQSQAPAEEEVKPEAAPEPTEPMPEPPVDLTPQPEPPTEPTEPVTPVEPPVETPPLTPTDPFDALEPSPMTPPVASTPPTPEAPVDNIQPPVMPETKSIDANDFEFIDNYTANDDKPPAPADLHVELSPEKPSSEFKKKIEDIDTLGASGVLLDILDDKAIQKQDEEKLDSLEAAEDLVGDIHFNLHKNERKPKTKKLKANILDKNLVNPIKKPEIKPTVEPIDLPTIIETAAEDLKNETKDQPKSDSGNTGNVKPESTYNVKIDSDVKAAALKNYFSNILKQGK